MRVKMEALPLLIGLLAAAPSARAQEAISVPAIPVFHLDGGIAASRAASLHAILNRASASGNMLSIPVGSVASSLKGRGQLGPINLVSPFKLALRLGAMVSPRTGIVAGVDVSLPQLHLLPGWGTRVDA